jgi:hypothetical protein
VIRGVRDSARRLELWTAVATLVCSLATLVVALAPLHISATAACRATPNTTTVPFVGFVCTMTGSADAATPAPARPRAVPAIERAPAPIRAWRAEANLATHLERKAHA